MIGAYRLDANNSRMGLSINQNISTPTTEIVSQGNGAPMVNAFGIYQEHSDGTGWESKITATLDQKDIRIQRPVVGTSEPGFGATKINGQGIQATLKHGFELTKNHTSSPYIGIRHTRSNLAGYREATSSLVTAPLAIAPVITYSTVTAAGIEGRYKPLPYMVIFASVGVERNLNTSFNNYVATNSEIGSLNPINVNSNIAKIRPTTTLGLYFDFSKNQRLGITGIYRQEMNRAIKTSTAMLAYTANL